MAYGIIEDGESPRITLPDDAARLSDDALIAGVRPVLVAHASKGRWRLRSKTGLVLSDVGTPTYGVDPKFGSILQPTSDNYVRISGMPNTGYPFTVAVFARKNRTNGAGANRSFTFGPDDFGSYQPAFFHQDNTAYSYYGGGVGASLSGLSTDWTLVVCVFESDTSRTLINVKGGVLTSASNTDSVSLPSWPSKLSIGQSAWNPNEWFGGDLALPMFFAGAMSARAAIAVERNPWQLFEADNDPVFYSLGAGGAAALAGSLAASGTVSGALSTAIKLAGSVSGSASVTAALTTSIRPAASVSATATVSAALTTAIQMAGSLSATASVSGDISGAAALASSVSASAIVTGALSTAIRLNASVSGAATVTGVLAEPGAAAALEASVYGYATVSANLTGGTSTIWTPASASSGTWTPASASSGTWTQA